MTNRLLPPSLPPPQKYWVGIEAFCGIMALIYLLLTPFGVWLISEGKNDGEALLNGIILVLMGPPLSIAFGLGVFFNDKPWHWIYGLVLICLSMTSCCCLPVSIPLMLHWLKPETKAFFEKSA